MNKPFLRFISVLAFLFVMLNQVQAQFQYIFPKNGTKNHFPETHIILRNGALMNASSVTADKVILTGSISGNVPANVVLSTDGKTVCITPAHPFAYTESVNVTVGKGLRTLAGEELQGTSFNFSIRREMTAVEKQLLEDYALTHDEDGNLLNDRQSIYVPSENKAATRNTTFGFINLVANTTPSLGKIYFHRNSAVLPQGYGIMQPNGDSVYYKASNIDGSNFQINLNGQWTYYRLNIGVDTTVVYADSSTHQELGTVHCANGLRASQHEHLFFPDGTKWFTIYDWQPGWDLTSYGGSPSATVNVSWIQKLDANNNVTFSWRCDDDNRFTVADATSDILLGISNLQIDPWHINSLFIDDDGHIIASFRNMDCVIKINSSNGDVMWHWGGSKNEFSTTNDPDGFFSHQHNVHRIENGNILMFDNGNLHTPVPFSQPKEYTINETNKTANCVWYYNHPQVQGYNIWTRAQGNVTRLPNGNTFIGYGLPNTAGFPNATEIDVNKNIVWEFRFQDSSEYSYRVYKYYEEPVGIDNINESSEFSVFPNPTNGLINLQLDIEYNGNVQVEVVNLLGQAVYTSENSADQLRNMQLDLTHLNEGLYLLHITAGEKKMTGRILIQ